MTYQEFLERKTQLGGRHGFEPLWMPGFLFDFQSHLVDWNIHKGRSATLADCGMGKTPMLLVWSQNVVQKTNKRILVLTPLAVAKQTGHEADKFGIEAKVSRDGSLPGKIVIANYERLHHFNPEDFCGVVCDEASCIKAMKGKLRDQVTEFMRTLPYRLLCTATAAPNDYVELGTLSEALGEMGQRDMITQFFVQETKKDYLGWGRTKYRMKGHAEVPFWKWVASWARACRRPSDLGFDDSAFVLPPLNNVEHLVRASIPRKDCLFDLPAADMREEREERRRTVQDRCQKVADLVQTGKPAVVWCHLNNEGDLLEKLIPDAKQIKGSQSIEEKEERFEAFANGQIRVLVIKPKIGAWGVNWQFCSHVVTFASHSYEQAYQLIRRCWRFGQKNTVQVDTVVTEGEQRAVENYERKCRSADRMFTELVRHMGDALVPSKNTTNEKERTPQWLKLKNSRNGTPSTTRIAVS